MSRKTKYLYRFALFGDDDATEVHVYGFIVADSQDEAFRLGDEAFTQGDSLDEARRLLGIDYEPDDPDDDEGGPFFSVNEVETIDDLASELPGLFIIGSTPAESQRLSKVLARSMAAELASQGVHIG